MQAVGKDTTIDGKELIPCDSALSCCLLMACLTEHFEVT
jgi:hypothetical protein